MALDNRRFVQFPHPGGEHSPDYDDWKEWNATQKPNGRDNPHARKFLEIGGAWLESDEVREGKLWAWAEWEPESRVLRRFGLHRAGMPRFLWEPTLLPKQDNRGLHNTDPFIFGGFYYTDCKQQSFEGLRHLGRGSVIVFGSRKKPHWVVDTIFVVADYVVATWGGTAPNSSPAVYTAGRREQLRHGLRILARMIVRAHLRRTVPEPPSEAAAEG